MIASRFLNWFFWGVAILCAVLVFRALIPPIVDTEEMKARQDIRVLLQVLEEFKKDHGHYPTQKEGLSILVDSPAGRAYFVSTHGITGTRGDTSLSIKLLSQDGKRSWSFTLAVRMGSTRAAVEMT